MRSPSRRPSATSRRRAGFTLAEVAVTLVIVGIALVFVLQGLNTAKLTAAHTHNRKVARELALLTLGQIGAGLFWEEMDDILIGTYAEEGYEDWSWEVVVGEDNFESDSELGAFDSWFDDDEDPFDLDEDEEEPFEKVRVKVTFPKLGEYTNELVLEHWIPWIQVYGQEQETVEPEDDA